MASKKLQRGERREKEILERHYSFDDNTINTIKKISTR
jgi:hypothetical protein